MLILAFEFDHVFGLRWLIHELYTLGFCESYGEILKFNRRLTNERIDDLLKNYEGFTKFVANNIDHNIATLDGCGTFHGMRVIAVIAKREQRREVIRSQQKY